MSSPSSSDPKALSYHPGPAASFENPWCNPSLFPPPDVPLYFRPVSQIFPISKDTCAHTNLPMAVILSPGLASPSALVDYSSSRLTRCSRCSAHLCPWSTIESDGKHWKCPFCGTSNLSLAGPSLLERPEGKCQVVDMIPPVPSTSGNLGPSFLFLFDLSF
jgi:hypothetical protein